MPTTQFTVNYELPVLTSPGGQGTCSVGTGEGETCPFLFSRKFGQAEVCLIPMLPEPSEHVIRRAGGGLGFTIPHKQCPVHTSPTTGDYQ